MGRQKLRINYRYEGFLYSDLLKHGYHNPGKIMRTLMMAQHKGLLSKKLIFEINMIDYSKLSIIIYGITKISIKEALSFIKHNIGGLRGTIIFNANSIKSV